MMEEKAQHPRHCLLPAFVEGRALSAQSHRDGSPPSLGGLVWTGSRTTMEMHLCVLQSNTDIGRLVKETMIFLCPFSSA
jgi:hypothetical protein